MKKATIAIIGGTGVYDLPQLNITGSVHPQTPWGKPSDEITLAEYTGKNGKTLKLAFLPRHGRGHFLMPTEIPQKANIAALKMLGVEEIISFSAVGSLKEEIVPRHFIIPDQIIDRTRHRPETFFGEGVVGHISFGDPFCPRLPDLIEDAIKKTDITYHTNETLVCMEGPAFSTRAESKLYKSWGAGLINMSAIPESKLARELEMCYQMICMATDYDSWRDADEAVESNEIMQVVKSNTQAAKTLMLEIFENLSTEDEKAKSCSCHKAAEYAIITAPEKQNPETREKLTKVLPRLFT